ncbi:MAG: hypothetical protein Q4C61_11645 [Lachnospiraceae bacterium]|nr:hypothetical protein [Lachnospiraceae bacterium]
MINNEMNAGTKKYSDIPVWRRYTLTVEKPVRRLKRICLTILLPMAAIIWCLGW